MKKDLRHSMNNVSRCLKKYQLKPGNLQVRLMKKLLFTFILFLSVETFAQSDLPPIYEIRVDTPVVNIPEEYWQMVADTSGKWTIDEVHSGPLSKMFTRYNKQGIGFSGLHHYWQRVRLKSLMPGNVKLVFQNQPVVDRYELYVFRQSGKREKFVSGLAVPMSKRSGYQPPMSIPVTLEAGEELLIYKKLFTKHNSIRNVPLGYSLVEPYFLETYVKQPWYIGDVRFWFIAGILFFGFFFNLFFFLIDKEKVYLYMALLLLLEGIWYLTTNNTITFRESPGIKPYFDIIINHCLFFAFVTQFARHFLKTRQYYPNWDKVVVTLLILMLTMALMRVFFFTEIFSINNRAYADFAVNTVFFSLMFSLLYSFLFLRKERDRLTNLSVIAAVPVLVMWSFVYYLNNVFDFLERQFEINRPYFFSMIVDKEMVIEIFLMAWFSILFTWILLQRYSRLRKQYVQQALAREREKTEIMNQQKELLERQVEERTAALRKSLEELQSTQSQLIQSEKMASLGELTAGIAHEIQNPLNFVNNFSEVNKELIGEMQQEIDTGNLQEVKKIAGSIGENEEKIIFHGKRADAIVKSMLQHSRTSTGRKELTDINALADEYLRLAYHGLRAKDKTFNAKFETELDPSLKPVNAVRQDIGRVILNLISNAFYTVNDKKKQLADGYDPTVKVQTKDLGDKISIAVRDNGNGIPAKVLDKIFQPFFTTKPAGEGTGLGLSLSYDIITKGHGGQLRVETKEKEGSTFIIELPKDR